MNKKDQTNCHLERNCNDVDTHLLQDIITAGNGKKFVWDRTNVEGLESESFLTSKRITDETTCGFWIFRGGFLQRFANQKNFVCLFGLVGCVFSIAYGYFNTIKPTLENYFKIASANSATISKGSDVGQLVFSGVLSYYAGKGHRPRWIGFGVLISISYCGLTALPHLLYGSSRDALSLKEEFYTISARNLNFSAVEEYPSTVLCGNKGNDSEFHTTEGALVPQVIFFSAQFIAGIGGSLVYTAGVTYMDDNIEKSSAPILWSLTYLLRMLGPILGSSLASFCMHLYTAPHLHPVIEQNDYRWLGAWWMGWFIISGLLAVPGLILTMYPKRLSIKNLSKKQKKREVETHLHLNDIITTFGRLIANPTYMSNNFSGVFSALAFTPYLVIGSKYIEIEYRQLPATSSFVADTLVLTFSVLGVLLAGFYFSKFQPKSRHMAIWNIVVGCLTTAGMLTFLIVGCSDSENGIVGSPQESAPPSCISSYQCDFVHYAPVCGENGLIFISPCHAGCRSEHVNSGGQQIYYDCSCIYTSTPTNLFPLILPEDSASTNISQRYSGGGQAVPGVCPADCFKSFITFVMIMCFLKLIGATAQTSGFLVSVRCVSEKDKTVAVGLCLMTMTLFTGITGPILFNWVLDKLCMVWGKTCEGESNCWLYDPRSLRYILNTVAAIFAAFGACCDYGVLHFGKTLQIFDVDMEDVGQKRLTCEDNVN